MNSVRTGPLKGEEVDSLSSLYWLKCGKIKIKIKIKEKKKEKERKRKKERKKIIYQKEIHVLC